MSCHKLKTLPLLFAKSSIQPSRNGISVHALYHIFLSEVCERGLDRTAKIYQIENLNHAEHGAIRAKGANVICPQDGNIGASYVDSLQGEDNVGKANRMLSYSWGYTIGDIVDTLVDYCESEKLNPKRIYVWICCLCNNQHRVYENKRKGVSVPFEEFQSTFYKCVTGIKHVLPMMEPWLKPKYLTRIWCIFEIFTATTNKTMLPLRHYK